MKVRKFDLLLMCPCGLINIHKSRNPPIISPEAGTNQPWPSPQGPLVSFSVLRNDLKNSFASGFFCFCYKYVRLDPQVIYSLIWQRKHPAVLVTEARPGFTRPGLLWRILKEIYRIIFDSNNSSMMWTIAFLEQWKSLHQTYSNGKGGTQDGGKSKVCGLFHSYILEVRSLSNNFVVNTCAITI